MSDIPDPTTAQRKAPGPAEFTMVTAPYLPSRVPSPEEVFRDFSTSYWLKDALRTGLDRDCLDAAMDAGVLATILQARSEEILGLPNRGNQVLDDLTQVRRWIEEGNQDMALHFLNNAVVMLTGSGK